MMVRLVTPQYAIARVSGGMGGRLRAMRLRGGRVVRILFICHGNICRSTMAEFVMKDLVAKRGMDELFEIDSAATSREEIGNGVHRGTREALRCHGVPCGTHRARQITRNDAAYYDLLVCMDQANVRNTERVAGPCGDKLVKLMSFAGESRDVADPWYTGDFETTYRDVSAGCEALLQALVDGRVPQASLY